jgi:hypothetical protein
VTLHKEELADDARDVYTSVAKRCETRNASKVQVQTPKHFATPKSCFMWAPAPPIPRQLHQKRRNSRFVGSTCSTVRIFNEAFEIDFKNQFLLPPYETFFRVLLAVLVYNVPVLKYLGASTLRSSRPNSFTWGDDSRHFQELLRPPATRICQILTVSGSVGVREYQQPRRISGKSCSCQKRLACALARRFTLSQNGYGDITVIYLTKSRPHH